MKILAAVDGSPRAVNAIEGLIEHLSWFREPPQLTLIYVHLAVPYKGAAAWAGKEAIHRYYDEESELALAGARTRLDAAGIAYGVEKRVGDPAHEIVACATGGHFELIVMGTHGHTALHNLVMGSVATKVLAGTTVPVLLFR
jgi:nucleotide-binding universal stress UspA family protein